MATKAGVLFTQTAYPPSIGGAQAYLHELVRYSADHYPVHVSAFWSEVRTDWLRGTTIAAPGGRDYVLDGIPVSTINYTTIDRVLMAPWVAGYYAVQRPAIAQISRRILPQLRAIDFRPILIHHGRVGRAPLGFASLALARELGVPFVLTPFHHPWWKGWPYLNYHRLYREADAILALTEAERQTLIGLGVVPERIVVGGTGAVIADTYDVDAFRARYNIDGRYVLFLGQKYPYKGFEALLDAAKIVWRSAPDVKFVFVGPRTKQSRKVFSAIDDPRIIETDIVTLPEKTAALAGCELLCVPSSQESFGGVYVEAWQVGRPVIGADNAAVAQVIEDSVDGFTGPVDPKFIAEKINLLLSDDALCQKMGDAGRQKAQRLYRWDILGAKTLAVYAALLAGSTAPADALKQSNGHLVAPLGGD